TVFENAKAKNCELLVFITDKSCNYHLEIKSLEQTFQILTQDIGYATAEKLFFSKDTKKNIVNKLNMKLGGINYVIDTPYFKDTKLVIGFESSQFGGLNIAN
uniref:Piwi domain-containing protein n=1 Tax=Caenorhabditis japonica TaxID=281687 RepID=A0A8R1EHM2_CAEJA